MKRLRCWTGMLQISKIVTKPWGREEWLELNDHYCYKRIYINAGHKTSLQYHTQKLETNYLIEGEAILWIEAESLNDLNIAVSIDRGVIVKDKLLWKIDMKVGEFVTINPGTIHRVEAVTDIILQEVSTPHVDDCIRLEDDTNRDHGRIDSEHN